MDLTSSWALSFYNILKEIQESMQTEFWNSKSEQLKGSPEGPVLVF